ncbi:hypothetical protein YB2330_004423 [Saitoella coloradoensis]
MNLYALALFAASLTSVAWAGTSCSYSGEVPDLVDITIDEIATYLESGTFTSVDLTTAYLARINEVNPILHAVIQINPDAIAIAAALDEERKMNGTRGPLHGVPILIKDNIATADKMNTTAGSFALANAKVPRDSTMAANLRKAGAVILGKTNLSQWANYRSSNSSNGWSAVGGQVYAAYVPMQDPSGSSSGSGVSSSIGLALATLGTETSGSILSPSQRNNLVGIKPTVGLTSRALVVPISEHQDTIGPMARTVKDAAHILSAIAGKDQYDNYTSAIPFDTIPDYAANLSSCGLKGAKIGIPRNAITYTANRTNAPVITAFNSSVQVLSSLGAEIFDNANFPAYAELRNSSNSTIVLNLDFETDLANYFSELSYNPQGVHDLADLANYTINDPREDYPDRNIYTWEQALNRTAYGNTSPEFWAAYQANLYLGGPGGIDGALESMSVEGGLDALILPTDFAAGIAAIVGYPVVTVPLGFYPQSTNVTYNARGDLVAIAPNVPFGLAFLGRPFSEQKLIQYAYAFEQATLVREKGPKPYIVPNVEVMDVVV